MSIINPIKCWDGSSYTNLDAKNIAFTSSLTGITLNNTGGGPSLQDVLIQINDNKVSKAGDTMTGTLFNINTAGNAKFVAKTSDIMAGGTQSSTMYGQEYYCNDSSGDMVASMRTTQGTNGLLSLNLGVRNKNAPDGSFYSMNQLMLRQTISGDNSVWVTSPEAWRSALDVQSLDAAETSETNRYTRYMKFEDGSLICMVEVAWTGKITTTYGSMFYNDSTISGGNWPVAFTGVPYMSITCTRGTMALVGPCSGTSKTSVGTLYIYRPSANTTNGTYYIDIIAYGRWK